MKCKTMRGVFLGCGLSIASLLSVVNASVLTGNVTVDNQYNVYLSTNDNAQGVLVSSDNSWYESEVFTATLAAGTDYFLHVEGVDTGGFEGFLGNFSLDSADHLFSNNIAQLLTNTIDWSVSTTGWGSYSNPSSYGDNTAYPWYANTRPTIDVTSAAEWIWSEDDTATHVYFSTAITAVPAPSTMAIFGLALAGFAYSRSKKQA
ncbi:PEP-CTERM sorting domain-containing protein [Psychromonas sp. SP041]|uniref:PEP-CTERM sorting domain-containing protein n=1 Tax=Psychromonas sp. SP041 TaxID=1365007 RepID=UPI00040945A1|nr:PEP-CTERM sorting domain-containing protein [Psychromonas sp. SP041]